MHKQHFAHYVKADVGMAGCDVDMNRDAHDVKAFVCRIGGQIGDDDVNAVWSESDKAADVRTASGESCCVEASVDKAHIGSQIGSEESCDAG